MQSEEMDNRIREAAENHHPAYNENAWPDMEKLLDKHLPQKKDDRRKYILFLLLFLLAGSGAWLLTTKPWKKQTVAMVPNENTASKELNTPATNNTGTAGNDAPVTKEPDGSNGGPATGTTVAGTTANETTTANDNKIVSDNIPSKDKTENLFAGPADTKQTQALANRNSNVQGQMDIQTMAGNKKKKGNKNPDDEKNNPAGMPKDIAKNRQTDPMAGQSTPKEDNKQPEQVEDNRVNNSNPVTVKTEISPAATPLPTAGEVRMAEEKKTDPVNEKAATKTKKPSAKKGNDLAISFSAGPDISMIGFDKTGRMKTILGAGLSYTFRNRITVSTGVYTARKIYTAAPADYKFAYLPPNYNYMTKIDGNCKVLAIPVNVSVNIGKTKNGNWYAGAGLTSLLMKTEKYDYEYKYPAGGTSYTYTYNVSNENKHLFSVLNISGGYRRNINRSVFVAAEPYLQLPLNGGVGAGKVKMNSAGILFTIGVKPFARK